MLGVSHGWPPCHPAERLSVKLLHEVSALQVAAGHVHHSLVLTIDGRRGFPDVEALLGLTNTACRHTPLVIQRAVDGACTTYPGLHCYDAAATARAFGETGAMDAIGLLYKHCMLKKMRYPTRSEESMAHSTFDQCGPSYAVFGNLILDGALHPMLQNPKAFAVFAEFFPELPKLVVDGVAQVANYAAKHVVSVPANNQMPHQAIHADPPSEFPRSIIVQNATLSTIENAAFSALHASGIIFSKNYVENLTISTGEGNVRTKRANRDIGDGVCRRVREPGFVTMGAEFVAGGSVAPASLVPAGDPAADGCPICTAHANWVTAHSLPGQQQQQRELSERTGQQQQQRELSERTVYRHTRQERKELKESQQRERQQQFQQRQREQEQQRQLKEWLATEAHPLQIVYDAGPQMAAGSKWILRNIGLRQGIDYNNAEVTVVSILPSRGAVVALKSGETMSVSLQCLHEMPPALDPDEPGPESEPQASRDSGMERQREASRADMHMAVDSDYHGPKPSRGLDMADSEWDELEQEKRDSQMTDAPSSPEPAHSSINASEWSSQEPAAQTGHSSVDPDDYSSESD